MSLEKSVKELVEAINTPKGTESYDTTAEVVRIDGDIAWVHIPGGVDETPVRLTINAVKGDRVQIRVGGGTAWIVGNETKPPTDDRVANIAQKTAENADLKAILAKKTADDASKVATNYIDFNEEEGLTVGYESLESKVNISGGGIKLYDEEGNVGTNIKAGVVVVGKEDESHLNIKANSFEQKNAEGISVLDIKTDGDVLSETKGVVLIDSNQYLDLVSTEYPQTLYERKVRISVPNAPTITDITMGGTLFYLYPTVTFQSYSTSGDTSLIDNVAIGSRDLTIRGNLLHINTGETKEYKVTFTSSAGALTITVRYECDYEYFKFSVSIDSTISNPLPQQSALFMDSTSGSYQATFKAPSYAIGTIDEDLGAFAIAIGENINASNDNQIVIGAYNKASTDMLVIGNGSDRFRNNVVSIPRHQSGSNDKVKVYGDLYVGCNDDSTGGKKVTSQAQGQVLTVSGVTAQSYKDYAVTFPTPYASTPLVVAGLAGTLTAYGMGMVSVAVNNVTTTGFTARVYNASSNDRNVTFRYIAIAP